MVQAQPNGCIDIWAREHYKSTIITKILTIFDIARNPELTFGFFSFKAPIAKAFLRNIMKELEGNDLLKALLPDVFWKDPKKEAPKWSEQEGILVKRKGNPNELTIEASGMVDGQPTSKHYAIKVFDDVVTLESVSTPDQMKKVREAYELADNLGKEGGHERVIGTRYHRYDLYNDLIKIGVLTPRIFPCREIDGKNEDDEPVYGKSVLYTEKYLEDKEKKQGAATFGAQMLCDPLSGSVSGFKRSWINYYSRDPWEESEGKNVYILVDPANSKRKDNDYTAMNVVGLGADGNYYLLDIVRARLNLTERTTKLFDLVNRWGPLIVGYEKYGKDSDIAHIQYVMDKEKGYRFRIVPVAGIQNKEDRIRRLVPDFQQGRWFFPEFIEGFDEDGSRINLVNRMIEEEYDPFPLSAHDDWLDSLSRIKDLQLTWPKKGRRRRSGTNDYYEARAASSHKDWMSY